MVVLGLHGHVLAKSSGRTGKTNEAHLRAGIAVVRLAFRALSASKVRLDAEILPDFDLASKVLADFGDGPAELVSDDERQFQPANGVRAASLRVEIG